MQQTCILPGVISHSAVISACEKDQQWQQAFGLLELMHQTRVLLGVISYSAVISACEKGQRWQQALGVLAAMQLNFSARSANARAKRWSPGCS